MKKKLSKSFKDCLIFILIIVVGLVAYFIPFFAINGKYALKENQVEYFNRVQFLSKNNGYTFGDVYINGEEIYDFSVYLNFDDGVEEVSTVIFENGNCIDTTWSGYKNNKLIKDKQNSFIEDSNFEEYIKYIYYIPLDFEESRLKVSFFNLSLNKNDNGVNCNFIFDKNYSTTLTINQINLNLVITDIQVKYSLGVEEYEGEQNSGYNLMYWIYGKNGDDVIRISCISRVFNYSWNNKFPYSFNWE